MEREESHLPEKGKLGTKPMGRGVGRVGIDAKESGALDSFQSLE